MTAHIALDEKDFRTLVAGGVVTVTRSIGNFESDIQIILSDIGFNRMHSAIADAEKIIFERLRAEEI